MIKIFTPDDPRWKDIDRSKLVLVQAEEKLHDAKFDTKAVGFFKDAVMRFCRSKVSILALVGIVIISLFAMFGPSMNSFGYNDQNLDYINLPPRVPALAQFGIFDGSRVLQNRRMDGLEDTTRYPEGSVLRVFNQRWVRGVQMCDVEVDYYKFTGVPDDVNFWIGSDYLGRDLWTRMWRGARVSLLIAFISVACNVCIGLVYGSIAGYYGGTVDMIMMRIAEIIGSLPSLVVVTLFILFFGTGMLSIVLALVVQNWIGTARMIRSQFYRYKDSEYVLASRTLGVKDRVLIFRHILPNSIGPVITRAMVAIPGAIFTESFLAYLGLGIKAPESSIGVLLSHGQKVMQQYPNQVLYPALMISVLMISFNMLSNGLRDAFDPTQRGA
ncbi:MAG: ABC transporter permease [Negativibacillus sp.]|nr:ABC transporter permease [Negativibacillus sp.]